MTKFTFRGLMPPTLTPFKKDFSLNLEVIPQYAAYLVKRNIQGVLINGTSGEGPSMSVAERKAVTEAWVKAAAEYKLHVMVQVGGAPFPDVIELVKHAASVNVGSILTLPELYNKPKTVDELVNYVKELSNYAPDTPILYYHIPSMSNVSLHMPTFITAAREKIPTFGGIKYTSFELFEGIDCLKAGRKDHAVFLGADQIAAGAVALGFNSGIATSLNMFPHLQKILEAAKQGDYIKARGLQLDMNEILDDVKEEASWVPLMKSLLNLMTPIDVGPVRFPYQPMTEQQVQRIRNVLTTRGLI